MICNIISSSIQARVFGFSRGAYPNRARSGCLVRIRIRIMKKVGSEFDHDIQTQNPCQCFFALSIDHGFSKGLLLLSQLN